MDGARSQAEDRSDRGGITRAHPVAARILRRWRRLTATPGGRDSGRRTLVACSGGADSCALASVLALVEPKPLIVHARHDIRSGVETRADADCVRELASRLGCAVRVVDAPLPRGHGNIESAARTVRYDALVRVARDEGIRFVATAHHADDQLETVLMRLIRGAGPRGIGGIRAHATVRPGVCVVRPMLGVTRDEARGLCVESGIAWREDDTNEDRSLLRNRIRAEVLPALRAIEPGLARRVSADAGAIRLGAEALTELARARWWAPALRAGGSVTLDRAELRAHCPRGAIEPILRLGIDELASGAGHDSIGSRQVGRVADAVFDASTERREFALGPMLVVVHAGAVIFSARTHDDGEDT